MRNFWLSCIIIIICRLLASYVFCTFDDAYITFHYAQQFAAGNGLVFNLHEKVLGTTAPLFALIASLPAFFSIPLPNFFVLFNLFCDVCSLYLIYRFFYDKNNLLLILFTVFFALDPTASRIAVGGMEANLFFCCSLLGIICYLRDRKTAAVLILSAIYFLRPEALILLFVVGGYEIYSTRKIPWLYMLLSGLVLALPLFLIHRYYGHFIPQSVIAKSAQDRSSALTIFSLMFFQKSFNYLLFPLAVFGFIRKCKTSRYILLSGIWLMLYAGSYFIEGPWVWTWYIYSMEVVQLIFAALAVYELAGLFHINLSRNAFLMAASVFILLIWVAVFFYMGRNPVERNVYEALKKDFPPGRAGPKDVFFADDIGALGYYTGGYIYDNLMLVTPQVMDYPDLCQRILHVNPEYLFVYTNHMYFTMIVKDSPLSGKYSFVKRYSRYRQQGLPLSLDTGVSNRYKQDYMLFKRND